MGQIIFMISAVINLFVVLASVGVFVYTDMIYEKPIPQDALEYIKMQKELQAASQVDSFKLDKLILNLYSRKTRLRFLEVQMHLIPFRKQYNSFIENFKTPIYDIIVNTTGGMTAEEINTLAGKIIYEERIKKEINRLMSYPVVKRILFTTFVVQ